MRALPLLMLLLALPLLPVQSCPPTAGYVGAIYRQGSDLSGLMRFLRESGISASISVGEHEFSPYSGMSFPSISLVIGSYEEGGELRAYVFTGSSYTLLMVETDVNLSDAPLAYAESLLSPYLNPELIVNTSRSPNNWIPPVPLAEWYRLEKGERLEVKAYKCGFTLSRMRRPHLPEVAVLANDIDRSLSFEVVRRALEARGIRVEYLGSDARALARARDYRVVIFLGGARAPRFGNFVAPILGNTSLKDYIVVTRPWATGGLAVVIAGADRYATRRAAESFSRGAVEEVVRFIGGEALGKVTTSSELKVELLSSSGRCGHQEEPSLKIDVEGSFAYATYSSGHANPCGRFVLSGYNISGGRINIYLRILDKGEICIQCLGILEAKLRIGPLPEGRYELCINNLCEGFEVRD
ncbi:MAG: hypothetical protein BA066_06630 [Candidatus Korarchaeota archaeon NZ13-K]|nr:MAG: hypothetical protein BA066_06630 [Candidatus Korarchaeota archaeon NZ13-K]